MSDDKIRPRTRNERRAYVHGYASAMNALTEMGLEGTRAWLREMVEHEGGVEVLGEPVDADKRFEYEGPLSVGFSYDGYSEIEVGDYGKPNARGVHRFDGDDLAYVIFDLIGGEHGVGGPSGTRVVKRVRVVVEVLDAEEHKPPPPPEVPTHDGVDFDPPPAPDFDPPPAPEMT